MNLASYIAGVITGSVFSNKEMQKTFATMTQKGANLVIDSLNKRGGTDAPTVQTDTISQVEEQN